ncbi:MAG: peptidase [Acidobacteria bacterium]|nr:peptidase [Acidobacteriota bacterium]
MLKHRRLLPFMLIALLATGCGSGGIGGTSSISLDQEWQLGDQLAAQVAQQVQLSRDSEAVSYVNSVGRRIQAATPLAGRPFHFYIVNDPSVNAFALPGGHVYIHSGLIAQADHANMLAGVMAHEISHVVARHSLKQMQQAQGINVLGSILLGQNPGALQQILAQVVAGGAMARFSRADEKQADDLGLGYMAAAGYDPHGMLEMFQKLASLEKSSPSAVEKFFLDHPVTTDRIHDIENRINQMGRTSGTVDDPQYQAIRRRVS